MNPLIKVSGALAAVWITQGCGGPCGSEKSCTAIEATSTRSSIQEKLVTAKEGDTIALAEGTYKMDAGLTLSTSNVTIKGAGRGKTILDFQGQSGAEGLLVDGNGFTLLDLTVQNTTGDGVKTQNSAGVTFRNVEVTWTSADKSTHGAYGLYPVQSSKVLIENCEVSGAADAGIYVGQSSDIIVRNNTAKENVAGIEIENSVRADVHDNTATANTAGILVFALPGLTKIFTDQVRVFNNHITSNNTVNFGDAESTVGGVPTGTGILVMAATNVEIFGNDVTGNDHVGAGVVSYFFFNPEFPATAESFAKLQPFSGNVSFHDNTFSDNGGSPDPKHADQVALFALAGKPDIVFDGVVSPFTTAPFSAENPGGYCAENNTGVTNVTVLEIDQATLGVKGFLTNKAQFQCSLPALPEVTL